MNKYIYLAGPIAGCSYKEATNWREAVSEDFLPGIVGISPMRLKEWAKRVRKITNVAQYARVAEEGDFLLTGESHAICSRDRNDVRTCDMLFAYLPAELNKRRPSWGTSIEIGWASEAGKPIVLVTDDKSLAAHPLVRESVGWIVPTLELGVAVVNSVFGVYVGEVQAAFGAEKEEAQL